MRILIVEDNRKLAEGLRTLLSESGYAVDCVADGDSALSAAKALDYDLVVLDLSLPHMDGLDVLRELRSGRIAVPVLILTARDGLEDRIRGLDLGADDYLTKPFEWGELEARVRALIRRAKAVRTSVIEAGSITFDLRSGQVLAGDTALEIPARETGVLRALLLANGRILSKGQLIESLSSFDEDISENAIEQYVSRLRRRLAEYGISIKAARGLGYYLRAADEK
ncbi:response regulator transcription factor [Hoeflea poritis]|uniref:Response regulator transcription factor n=1 Tax=Hoeflea poritis TaxID=2993659 RepID=A0ABT4VTI7_9HYPH|nr:response regulator transcription factor [Hoeflea poritis]MDA4848029.1 response regulator transcription factor [Hoeflea poritis]